MRAARRILPATILAMSFSAIFAETTFLPEIRVTESYTDAVSIGGGIGQGDSDVTSEVGLIFPWSRRWQTGSFTFSYTPSFVWYQEYDDLNNDQHRVNFDANQKPDAKSDVRYRLSYMQTQAAPNLASSLNEEDPAQSEFYFLSNNTKIETYNAGIDYQRQLTRGWSWSAGIAGFESKATNLESTDPMDGFVDDLENNRSYRGRFAMARQFSRENSAGIGYGYSQFLQDSGDTDLHELTLSYERNQADRWKFGVRAGGYSQSQDGPSGDSGEGFTGRLVAARTMRRTTVQLAGTRSFSSGGNLDGTAVNTFGILSVVGKLARSWRWNASALYGINRPQLATTGKRTNESANAGIAWVPPRKPVELQLRVTYQERTYEDPMGTVLEGISGDFTTVAASLAWRLPGYGKRTGS